MAADAVTCAGKVVQTDVAPMVGEVSEGGVGESTQRRQAVGIEFTPLSQPSTTTSRTCKVVTLEQQRGKQLHELIRKQNLRGRMSSRPQ
jgi:hypothetical protein